MEIDKKELSISKTWISKSLNRRECCIDDIFVYELFCPQSYTHLKCIGVISQTDSFSDDGVKHEKHLNF